MPTHLEESLKALYKFQTAHITELRNDRDAPQNIMLIYATGINQNVPENEMYKIPRVFSRQMDQHPNPVRIQDLALINKK